MSKIARNTSDEDTTELFKPKINKNSEKIAGYKNKDEEDVGTRLYKHAEIYHQKKEELLQSITPSFIPKICKRTQKIAKKIDQIQNMGTIPSKSDSDSGNRSKVLLLDEANPVSEIMIYDERSPKFPIDPNQLQDDQDLIELMKNIDINKLTSGDHIDDAQLELLFKISKQVGNYTGRSHHVRRKDKQVSNIRNLSEKVDELREKTGLFGDSSPSKSGGGSPSRFSRQMSQLAEKLSDDKDIYKIENNLKRIQENLKNLKKHYLMDGPR